MWWFKKKKITNQEQMFVGYWIFDYLDDGILVIDQKNRVFLANFKAAEYLRIKKEDLIGKSILELNKYLNLRDLAVLSQVRIRKEERKEKIKPRDNFFLEAKFIPLKTQEEEVKNILIILYDITREVLTEKAKSEFIRLSTHQLWTPASGIKWSLKMLLNEELGELNNKQKELLKEIYEANEREIKLIGDLLTVAEIESGNVISEVSLLNIEEIIQSAINDCEKMAIKKGVKIIFREPKERIPKVMVDEEKIKMAIRNIIDNAIRYNKSSKGIVEVGLERREKEIRIEISDNGLGIPYEEQRKVFSKFFRGKNILQIDTTGSGLGLYIAKSIIEAHNGRIWFESEENKGTTFYFTLPIKKKFGEFLSSKFY